MHFGIDFGARLSGKTVVAWLGSDGLHLDRVAAGADADEFLDQTVQNFKPQAIYLDAPLSLPSVYRHAGPLAGRVLDAAGNNNGDVSPPAPGPGADWFLRESDRELGAMSPLFLGGLTARAMRLAATWQAAGIPVIETWPRGVVKVLELPGYRAKGSNAAAEFSQQLPALGFPETPPAVADWHEADALLAWWAGARHRAGEAKQFGASAEGLITC